MRKVVVYALIFVTMWSISQLLIVIFSCTPIEKFWFGDSIPNGHCMPNLPFWYINAAGNIVTDVLIFIIPPTGARKSQSSEATENSAYWRLLSWFLCKRSSYGSL